jgi:hypothetical protein
MMTRNKFSLPEPMKTLRTPLLLSLALGLLFLAACATTRSRYALPTDYIAPMDKLSSAVYAELHNPFSAKPLSGDQLLVAAMNQKPELQKAFKHASLLITNQDGNAVLMLLSPTNHNVAWLEYATWSRQLARYHFLSNPPSPAKFTILLPETAPRIQP